MIFKLSKRIINISPSETLQITSKAKQLKAGGISVLNLSAGEPDFNTPEHIKESAIKAINGNHTRYTPVGGIPELRKAVCEEMLKTDGVRYEPDEAVISCGAKHSIYNILQVLIQDGDEVIVISPYWVSYPAMVTLAGGKTGVVKTRFEEKFTLKPEVLNNAINKKTKLIIVNSPCNPTGVVYDAGLLEKIAEIALKNKIFIISDEIYKEIIFDGVKTKSIVALNPAIKDYTIVVRGASKKYAMTGWRIGYSLGPKPVIEAISKLQSHSTSNPTSISQIAALCALNSDQKCVVDMAREFQKRRDFAIRRIESIKAISCVKPQGAFYIFCDISESGLNSREFAEKLLEEESVAVIPGSAFGEDGFIRISFAQDIPVLSEAFDKIDNFLKKRRK